MHVVFLLSISISISLFEISHTEVTVLYVCEFKPVHISGNDWSITISDQWIFRGKI